MTVRSNDMYTQEQLESMSDFEINKLAAEKEGVKWHLSPYSKSNDTPHWIYCDNWDSIDGDSVYLPDYCNSWADMGPIIEGNKISLQWALAVWVAIMYYDASLDASGTLIVNKEIIYQDSNPLRAAAIVYLMMERAQ